MSACTCPLKTSQELDEELQNIERAEFFEVEFDSRMSLSEGEVSEERGEESLRAEQAANEP